MTLPLNEARCEGIPAGPSGHQVAEQCTDCQRRTAPRAEVRSFMDPPLLQSPCPMRIAPARLSQAEILARIDKAEAETAQEIAAQESKPPSRWKWPSSEPT